VQDAPPFLEQNRMTTVNRRKVLTIMGAGAAAALARPAAAGSRDHDDGRRQKFVLIHGAWHGGFA
jgi:hypothetical protein